MSDPAAGLEPGCVARLEHGLAVVLGQHQLAFEYIDEFVFRLVRVTQRGRRAGLDARDVDAELRQPHGVAELLLLASGDDGGEFLRIGRDSLCRNDGNIDLWHANSPHLISDTPCPTWSCNACRPRRARAACRCPDR